MPANWQLSSKQEFKKIKHNTADSRFLLGIRSAKKGFLYLSDYNLTVDNCNNKQFADSMRTFLKKASNWSIKYSALKTELKEPVQKTLGSYNFTVLENDYIFRNNNKTMMSTLFYIGPTINNHVLVGFTNVSDLTELKEVESGFSYSRDTTSMVDLFFSHKKDNK